MNNSPLLSIHLLTFNHENHIVKCLDSIVNQSISYNIEIVITDDASSDDTPRILFNYKENYPELINLKIHTKNKGLVKSYFETVKRCNGKYIFDIAGDDFFNKENTINLICKDLEDNNDIDFIEYEFDELYDKTGQIKKNCNSTIRNIEHKEYLYKVFKGEIWPTAWCVKTDCINKLISLDELIDNNINVEDFPIAIELLANNKKFIHSTSSVMTYRKHSGSISNPQELSNRFSFNHKIINNQKYYYNKYSLPQIWYKEVEINHYKAMLHTSGVYGDKKNGSKYFNKIKQNNSLDFKFCLHYLSSQHKILRFIFSYYRKIN